MTNLIKHMPANTAAGFYRAEQRAEYITSYEIHHRMDFNETHERKFATLKLVVQIAEILRPLLDFGPYTEAKVDFNRVVCCRFRNAYKEEWQHSALPVRKYLQGSSD